MKEVRLNDVVILDFGEDGYGNNPEESLLVIPLAVLRDKLEGSHPCGGFETFRTRKGRQAVRVLAGETHTLTIRNDSRDKSWDGWFRRFPVGNTAYSIAGKTSAGGGCWCEVSIVPNTGETLTAEQAEYQEEITA